MVESFKQISLLSITSESLSTLRLLNKTLFPVRYADSFYSSLLFPNPERVCRILSVEGHPIGVIHFKKHSERRTCYLISLGVLAPYRGFGLGSYLLDFCLKHCKREWGDGVDMIELHVQASNWKALQFYERHGFKRISLEADYYNNVEGGSSAWRMQLQLCGFP